MVSQLNVVSEEHAKVTRAHQVIENVLHVDKFQDNDSALGLALRVSSALQTTLDIEQLIRLFSTQIKPAVPHDGISYSNENLGCTVATQDTKSANTCTYRLLVHGEPLGEISLARSWEFTQEDMKVFEYTLCSLVYPLRNAIMYRDAVMASHKDPLTGVNNRAALDEALSREVRLAKRYERPLSILVLDIDHFKAINDNFGHTAGDYVIKTTAKRTASCIRSTDMLFRYGGEEFVMLLNNTDSRGAAYLAERIRKAIHRTQVRCGGNTVSVTVSLGVATLEGEESETEFFTRADTALYQAKREGRNCVRVSEKLEKA